MDEAVLTPRQLEYARLVAYDLTTQEIADALGVSHGTCRNMIEHIRDIKGFRTRVGLAVWYVQTYGVN